MRTSSMTDEPEDAVEDQRQRDYEADRMAWEYRRDGARVRRTRSGLVTIHLIDDDHDLDGPYL